MANYEHFLNGRIRQRTIIRNYISEENLSAFCSQGDFLAVIRNLKQDESEDYSDRAQMAVNRMNACRNNLQNSLRASLFVLEAQTGLSITGTPIFENCQVV